MSDGSYWDWPSVQKHPLLHRKNHPIRLLHNRLHRADKCLKIFCVEGVRTPDTGARMGSTPDECLIDDAVLVIAQMANRHTKKPIAVHFFVYLNPDFSEQAVCFFRVLEVESVLFFPKAPSGFSSTQPYDFTADTTSTYACWIDFWPACTSSTSIPISSSVCWSALYIPHCG